MQQPPAFDPATQIEEAVEFFSREGFCSLSHTLSAAQLQAVHDFMDSSQASDPAAWSIYEQPEAKFQLDNLLGDSSAVKRGVKAKMSQVLLETDQLDWCTRLPTLLPFMDRLFGAGNSRYAEFNLRETPSNQRPAQMGFHHDKVEPSRLTRQPYGAPDWLCTVVYLVDMDQYSPNFAVVPRSNRFESLEAAKEGLGPEYCEQPIWGAAGTCVVYDTAICESGTASTVCARLVQNLVWCPAAHCRLVMARSRYALNHLCLCVCVRMCACVRDTPTPFRRPRAARSARGAPEQRWSRRHWRAAQLASVVGSRRGLYRRRSPA
jgi:hypothetical protein